MSTISDIFKKPLVQAALVGAFGGMAPRLIELVPKLFNNIYPSNGYLLALAILALIGGIITAVYKEKDLKRALVLGAGAQAIIGTLAAQAVAPAQKGILLPFGISIVSTVYAQENSQNDTVKFVIKRNESRFKLNDLWIRADSKTIDNYKLNKDTLIVPIPANIKELSIDLPSDCESLKLSDSVVSGKKLMQLEIINDQDRRDFWQTLGNANVPRYRIKEVGKKNN